jgi:carbon-monoxide dehydrogenase large subunit
VVGVLTGADVAAAGINGLPCGWLITSTNGEPMKEPPHPILALDTVRYVGDQVAMVVAETLQQARDAAELVEVDYDVLPAVVNVADAAGGKSPGRGSRHRPGQPLLPVGDWRQGSRGCRVCGCRPCDRLDLVNNRLIPNAMEPRVAIGSYNRAMDEYTLYVANQNPHVERLLMTAFVMGLPRARCA